MQVARPRKSHLSASRVDVFSACEDWLASPARQQGAGTCKRSKARHVSARAFLQLLRTVLQRTLPHRSCATCCTSTSAEPLASCSGRCEDSSGRRPSCATLQERPAGLRGGSSWQGSTPVTVASWRAAVAVQCMRGAWLFFRRLLGARTRGCGQRCPCSSGHPCLPSSVLFLFHWPDRGWYRAGSFPPFLGGQLVCHPAIQLSCASLWLHACTPLLRLPRQSGQGVQDRPITSSRAAKQAR